MTCIALIIFCNIPKYVLHRKLHTEPSRINDQWVTIDSLGPCLPLTLDEELFIAGPAPEPSSHSV